MGRKKKEALVEDEDADLAGEDGEMKKDKYGFGTYIP
jgi:hypothetical protein